MLHHFNPTAEDGYWREAYTREPYYMAGRSYDDYAPAYALGYDGRSRYNTSFDAAETHLASDWDRSRGMPTLSWDQAKLRHVPHVIVSNAPFQVTWTATVDDPEITGVLRSQLIRRGW